MAKGNGVWVFSQIIDGEVAGVTLELLGEGRRLADLLSVQLTAVLPGFKVGSHAETLVAAGADRVLLLDDAALMYYHSGNYGQCLEELARRHEPQVFLFGATQTGKDLAAVLAARLKTGLTAHCAALEIDEDRRLRQIVPAFGGRCVFISRRWPQMSTVVAGVFPKPVLDFNRQGEILEISCTGLTNSAVKVVDFKASPPLQAKLAEAEVIVGAGAGIGDLEGYKLLEELAEQLGGVLGATRPMVDEGWAGEEQMIGQSGCSVHPKLYIAVGISGDPLHLSGVRDPDVFIAINKDPKANIFRHAHYGVVADYRLVIPPLMDLLKK